MKIDIASININEEWQWFGWNYINSDSLNRTKVKMEKYPIFIEGNHLFIISSDNQLIKINIIESQIENSQNAYQILSIKGDWSPKNYIRKFQKVKYPDDFYLPRLKNNKTIENALAELFQMHPSDRDEATVQIYFHTLMINKDGKSEKAYVKVHTRSEVKKDFHVDYDANLQSKINDWIATQRFSTSTFPKDFNKFKYSDFIYLK